MSWLIDTSVIARTIHAGTPLQQAAMQARNLQNLLTFNVADFKRYEGLVRVFSPHDLLPSY